ncbi:bifunctional metallophosphatase/5'-nucleotidase [Arthrobacter pigmenti]
MSLPPQKRPRSIAAAIAAGCLAIGLAGPAAAAPDHAKGSKNHTVDLTVMGTTDLHGHVENWDYFKNAEYDDGAGNDVGLAKISTLVDQVRADRGDEHTLLIDSGDTIQGTSLTNYFANVEPITDTGDLHPVAAAMNAIGYDAAALGNHEFNYGLPLLRKFESQLDFPLLAANAVGARTGEPAFQPYVIKTVNVKGAKPVQVGILGLTNPGVAIWDKHNVEGKLSFPGIVEQAQKFVPQMKAAGADVVVASAHSGTSGTSTYGDELPVENASTALAKEVPGIDAVLVGHAHEEIEERFVTNEVTGERVLLTEPLKWGMRLSVMDFELAKNRGQWDVTSMSANTLNTNTVAADPEISELVADEHQTVIDYVNTPIGTATESMPAAESRYRDTAVMDFVNEVQANAVDQSLEDGPNADLPVISIAAPFNREAGIPQGPVTIRDIAGLYIYPNTLFGVEMTGAQIKDYLEYSARYFAQLEPGEPVNIDNLTNAGGIPDYNYDMISGLTYEIDVSEPVGERITNLQYQGKPVDPDQRFAVATNNYRQSGGGNFPHIDQAPVLVNQQQEIRQLLINYVTEQGTINPDNFHVQNWWLTQDGERLFG